MHILRLFETFETDFIASVVIPVKGLDCFTSIDDFLTSV